MKQLKYYINMYLNINNTFLYQHMVSFYTYSFHQLICVYIYGSSLEKLI